VRPRGQSTVGGKKLRRGSYRATSVFINADGPEAKRALKLKAK
jgi:hypothetical protein